jgi:hypothetical protein
LTSSSAPKSAENLDRVIATESADEEGTMMRIQNSLILVILASLILSVPAVLGNDYQGTIRTGYIFTDVEGNQGVHQPTYNLYDGVMLSLEQFRYDWDNGMRLSADIINPTLKNRRAKISFGCLGYGGVTLQHNSYRRTYDFDGANFTRRQTTSGTAWIQPIKQVKLFGGAGVTDKNGTIQALIEPSGGSLTNLVDYLNRYYNAGLEIKHQRSYGRIEYRASDYSSDISGTDERSTSRLRLTACTPMPEFDRVVLGAGYQHFENKVENRDVILSSNTVWGVARYSHALGYQLRYSFIFDRSSRTGDLAATDNILHAITAGKDWKSRGGLMVGYGHHINDDIRVGRSGDDYSVSGWLAPLQQLSLRAGIGFVSDNVDSGRTLTGDRDYARGWLSARYRFTGGFVRLKIDDRHRSNDDIGSEFDFMRASGDVSLTDSRYGDVLASYSFGDGEYCNSSGAFDYSEHILSGNAFSSDYRGIQVGFGGDYYRARRDVDVEAFTVRVTGRYRVYKNATLEVVYSAHNFDNFDDLPAPYLEYYTANVVEASIRYEL